MRGGFPQVVAAIDGSHIQIIAPDEQVQDYFNRKQFSSINLQACVDSNGLFCDTFVGMPGSVHDARVLKRSALYTKLKNGTLFSVNRPVQVQDVEVPLMLIGDPAYLLMKNLMRPYSGRNRLTPTQNRFNYKLSQCRVVVETAFGGGSSLIKTNMTLGI
ncbi:protein ALP1-like [Anneissia japonica]|uniref:protein ALP1-like n=1 Tax=Anneissia japonica TaxID=1529436 RepID=UPI0014256F90|nr:protein ALP1-like [Anneissia japonica]